MWHDFLIVLPLALADMETSVDWGAKTTACQSSRVIPTRVSGQFERTNDKALINEAAEKHHLTIMTVLFISSSARLPPGLYSMQPPVRANKHSSSELHSDNEGRRKSC